MASNIPFVSRIEKLYEKLSPNARKVANYLQQNPLDVLNTSVADIAEVTQTSKATVSRFFRQLGYESQLDLKKELRQVRASGYPIATEKLRSDHVVQELDRIRQTWESVDPNEIEILADDIANASRITLIGFRNSYPVALHFRQQLLQIRNCVRLLPQPAQTLSEELLDIEKDELIILIGFRRRPKIVQRLIEELQDKNMVMLADPSAQIYKSSVKQLLICQLGRELPLDSYAAPMSIISVICNSVLSKVSDSEKRITDISNLYDDLDELE